MNPRKIIYDLFGRKCCICGIRSDDLDKATLIYWDIAGKIRAFCANCIKKQVPLLTKDDLKLFL